MRIRTATMAGLLLATSPGALWAADAGTTPLFTVNLGTTAWTAAVFLALLGILWRFAWGPILAAVDAREKAIQGALDGPQPTASPRAGGRPGHSRVNP